MWITGGDSMGNHPNARVKMSHSSLVFWMRRNKSWMALFSPMTFKVSMGGNNSVGIGIHVGKVGNKEASGKRDSKAR